MGKNNTQLAQLGGMPLGTLLGVWRYSRTVDGVEHSKYWEVRPTADGEFAVSWSTSRDRLGMKSIRVDAAGACRRVLSKIRGGYKLREPVTIPFPQSEDTVRQILGAQFWERIGYSGSGSRTASALTDWLEAK